MFFIVTMRNTPTLSLLPSLSNIQSQRSIPNSIALGSMPTLSDRMEVTLTRLGRASEELTCRTARTELCENDRPPRRQCSFYGRLENQRKLDLKNL